VFTPPCDDWREEKRKDSATLFNTFTPTLFNTFTPW
jgi:hypothetical protein